MMEHKVIILLAAHNGEKFIHKQIQSILAQSIKPKKILVNVDQSTDNTLNIVQNYMKKYSEIKILNFDIRFGSAAANFINLFINVDFKNYDFIALADQDDVWKQDKLEKAINKLAQGYDGYSSNVEAFWENGNNKILIKNQPQQNFDFLFESAGPGCTFVLNKNLALSLQNFLKRDNFTQICNYHDWLIYAFARSSNFKWFIDSYVGVYYRQHACNVFGANVGLKAFISRVIRVISGDGFDFSFRLIRDLKVKNKLIQSLFPISRINLLRLATYSRHCRRRKQDQIYFFFACILLAIFFPRKIHTI